MSISRRSFLKIFAAVPAVAISGLPEISFSEESQGAIADNIQEKEQSLVGYMRETIAYDIGMDMYVIRHDVTDGKNQWSVTQPFYSKHTDKRLSDARSVAVTELRKKLKENGIRTVSALPNHWPECKTVRFA